MERTCRRVALSLSLSLSHLHTPVCTHIHIELQLYLYQAEVHRHRKVNGCSSVVEMSCSQLKLLVWDWKRVGKRSKYCVGRAGKTRAEPRQEADSLSHMAVRFPLSTSTSQFYILPLHMSTTEATQC